jgi:hypothetical protein
MNLFPNLHNERKLTDLLPSLRLIFHHLHLSPPPYDTLIQHVRPSIGSDHGLKPTDYS